MSSVNADTPLSMTFVGDSPRVEENRVIVRFTTNKSIYSAMCYLGRVYVKDCMSGMAEFTDVIPDSYTLRVVAWDKQHFGHKIIKRLTIHVLGRPRCVRTKLACIVICRLSILLVLDLRFISNL